MITTSTKLLAGAAVTIAGLLLLSRRRESGAAAPLPSIPDAGGVSPLTQFRPVALSTSDRIWQALQWANRNGFLDAATNGSVMRNAAEHYNAGDERGMVLDLWSALMAQGFNVGTRASLADRQRVVDAVGLARDNGHRWLGPTMIGRIAIHFAELPTLDAGRPVDRLLALGTIRNDPHAVLDLASDWALQAQIPDVTAREVATLHSGV